MNLVFVLNFFGILQGCTDVFPISSSGHLALARQFLNYHDLNLGLAASLHIGTLIAIVIYFYHDLTYLWSGFRSSLVGLRHWTGEGATPFGLDGEQNIIYYLILSLIPVSLEGLLLKNVASQVFEDAIWVSVFFIINALVLTITAWNAHGERTLKELSLGDFLWIGLVQGIAVLPGISRLGIVICAGLWRRLNWQEALRLAFILSIPVVAGSMVLEGKDILGLLINHPTMVVALVLAISFAAVFSFIGLKFFTSRYLERRKLAFFGNYCFMIGLTSLIYLELWR
jgi:undecaprenyl-diphosphatase